MMQRPAILAALLALAGGPAALADPIGVRSGAHDSFARLVLRLPEGVNWDIARRDEGVTVSLRGHSDGFDTGEIFSRIDRSYIASVSGTDSALDIGFACECRAEVFSQSPDLLVIDVAGEPKAPAAAPVPVQSPPFDRFVGTQPLVLPGQANASAPPAAPVRPPALPIVVGQPPRIETPAEPAPEERSTGSVARGVDLPLNALPDTLDGADLEQLSALQQTLAERVGLAATRGLLDPVSPRIDLPLIQEQPQIDTRIFDTSAPQSEPDPEKRTPPGSNIRVSSSADLPSSGALGDLTSPTSGVQCPAPEVFDLPAWAPEDSMSRAIAKHRQALFTEFDRLDETEALALARTYLHFGFGAEASQVLHMSPSLAESHPALIDMAQILEFGSARGSQHLLSFADCETPAALWAVLAADALTPSRVVNVDAALRALTALPLHLRSYLAPELSRRLLAFGDTDAAALALRSVERTAGPAGPDAALARADLDMKDGKTAEAQDALADIVASNEEQSAEALIKFVESHLRDGTPIDQDVATLVESYATELRDDPRGAALRRTHVLALAKSDQFDAAVEALNRAAPQMEPAETTELRNTVLGLLTEAAEDVAFLEYAFEQVSRAMPLGDADLALGMAERLVALGFAAEAEMLLQAQSDLPMQDRLRLLRARIALDLSRPREAEAQLFGVETESAERLRAEAKAMAGEFAEAGTLYDALGDGQRSLTSDWLAENWQDVAKQEAAPLADAARLATSEIAEIPAADGMLGQVSDALVESAEARQVIETLLATPSGNSAPDGG